MDYAGTIDAVGRLPFILQIFFMTVFSVAFIAVLLFGFGKKWKGLIALIRDQQEQGAALDEAHVVFDLKKKSDDIDVDMRMRVFRRTRALIFNLLSDYADTCPLFVVNLRLEAEAEIRDYIFENHLIRKAFSASRESERARLRTTASEIYKQSSLAAKATSCSQYVEPPKWEKIKSALDSFVDAFFSILREEVKGACSEKILLYEYSELLIKSEKLRKTACEIPKQKNEDYIRKIG